MKLILANKEHRNSQRCLKAVEKFLKFLRSHHVVRVIAIHACLLSAAAQSQVIDKNGTTQTGSLWSNEVQNPLLDRTARNIGDIVTIVISENSVSTFKAGTSAKKDDSNNVAQKLFIGFLDRIFKPFATSASSSNKGEGDTNQAGKMSARMSAIVKKVFPNGSMIIEGTRNIMTNKEVQIIKLSGVIRRDDIRPDNTVKSENIAEAEIRMEGKGLIADRQRRGLLTRILDWLF